MNDLQKKLVEFASQREDLKNKMKSLDEEMSFIMTELGEGNVFQDDDGVVFRIIIPKGTYIEFKHISYERTRKEGEKGGNFLSKKEAEEAGFVLSK